MTTDPYAVAVNTINELITRKVRPLSSLEATFHAIEAMSEDDARATLHKLIAQRYLCQVDGDIAQLLATRLGVAVQWSHARLALGDLEWKDGRGTNE